MWVYRSIGVRGKPVWEVGYYIPSHHGTGKWEGTTQYPDEWRAMRAVHYLNGGGGASAPWIPPVKSEK